MTHRRAALLPEPLHLYNLFVITGSCSFWQLLALILQYFLASLFIFYRSIA